MVPSLTSRDARYNQSVCEATGGADSKWSNRHGGMPGKNCPTPRVFAKNLLNPRRMRLAGEAEFLSDGEI